MIFFTDRDLGNRFPDILQQAGFQVDRHRDHFSTTCRDEEWLAEVGRRGWVAITHNSRIRYTPNQLAAVRQHKVSLIIVVGKAAYSDLATNFVNTGLKIQTFLTLCMPPLIAKVTLPSPSELTRHPSAAGTIELWYPAGKKRHRTGKRP